MVLTHHFYSEEICCFCRSTSPHLLRILNNAGYVRLRKVVRPGLRLLIQRGAGMGCPFLHHLLDHSHRRNNLAAVRCSHAVAGRTINEGAEVVRPARGCVLAQHTCDQSRITIKNLEDAATVASFCSYCSVLARCNTFNELTYRCLTTCRELMVYFKHQDGLAQAVK